MQYLALLFIKAVLRSTALNAAGPWSFIFHPLEDKGPMFSCWHAGFSLVELIGAQWNCTSVTGIMEQRIRPAGCNLFWHNRIKLFVLYVLSSDSADEMCQNKGLEIEILFLSINQAQNERKSKSFTSKATCRSPNMPAPRPGCALSHVTGQFCFLVHLFHGISVEIARGDTSQRQCQLWCYFIVLWQRTREVDQHPSPHIAIG